MGNYDGMMVVFVKTLIYICPYRL